MYEERTITITEEVDHKIKEAIRTIVNTGLAENSPQIAVVYAGLASGFLQSLRLIGLDYTLYLDELYNATQNEVQEQTEGEVQEQLGVDSSETA